MEQKNNKQGFVSGRIKSVKYALKGVWILFTTEDSIKAQSIFVIFTTILGFISHITPTQWIAQTLAIGLVLVAEALNTAIEEVANFIHPDYHVKIGKIKDIAAGGPAIAAIVALIIAGIIYTPKILELF